MITLDIRRWGVRQLVGAAALYWTGLAAVTLAPFARVVASIAQLGGGRGSASASLGNDLVTISALRDNVAVYTGTVPLLDIALWISLPPLALWLVWLALRPSRRDARGELASQSYNALPDAARAGFGAAPSPTGAPIERRETRG